MFINFSCFTMYFLMTLFYFIFIIFSFNSKTYSQLVVHQNCLWQRFFQVQGVFLGTRAADRGWIGLASVSLGERRSQSCFQVCDARRSGKQQRSVWDGTRGVTLNSFKYVYLKHILVFHPQLKHFQILYKHTPGERLETAQFQVLGFIGIFLWTDNLLT